MTERDTALKHLRAAAEALMTPDALSQAQAIQRHAELAEDRPGFWAHVEQVTGGYVVTISFDALSTPFGPHVPESSNRRFACADLTEVMSLLERRFA